MSGRTSVDSSGYLSNLALASTVTAPIAAIGMVNLTPVNPATINNGIIGSLVYNSTNNTLNYWNGTAWKVVTAT